MSEIPNGLANDGAAGEARRVRRGRRLRPVVLSVIGLVGGIAALGLAVIPDVTYAESDERATATFPDEPKGGLTLRFKNIAFTVGANKLESAPAPAPAATADPRRPFRVAAVIVGLLSLGTAAFAHLRERHTALTSCAVLCAAAAVGWQYLAAGLAIGAAIAVVLVVVAILGPILH